MPIIILSQKVTWTERALKSASRMAKSGSYTKMALFSCKDACRETSMNLAAMPLPTHPNPTSLLLQNIHNSWPLAQMPCAHQWRCAKAYGQTQPHYRNGPIHQWGSWTMQWMHKRKTSPGTFSKEIPKLSWQNTTPTSYGSPRPLQGIYCGILICASCHRWLQPSRMEVFSEK